jgi:beta-lactam-binding protein with PASTA domain
MEDKETPDNLEDEATGILPADDAQTELPPQAKPQRRPIVPHWIPIALGITLGLLVLASGVVAWMSVGAQIEVPDVMELNEGLAEVKLSEAGLETTITERRFDDAPEGTVIEQFPEAGTTVQRGEPVGLVVSAGSDTFEMPDIVGQNVRVARARLESEGLLVKVDAQQSELPKDTVISSNPSPGAEVRTGEIVRITIASEGSATDALLPYSLDGATFVIDPSEAADDGLDVPLDVSRRLQSLLEASGAKVIATRSAAETATDEAQRVARVPATGVTAVIGLDVASSGANMIVRTLDEAAAQDTYQASTALGDELMTALQQAGYQVKKAEMADDAVLTATSAAGARTTLGSTASDDDMALFRDPAWADAVARAIYQGLGERFGSR